MICLSLSNCVNYCNTPVLAYVLIEALVSLYSWRSSISICVFSFDHLQLPLLDPWIRAYAVPQPTPGTVMQQKSRQVQLLSVL